MKKLLFLLLFFPLIILSQTSEEVPTLHQEINGIKIGVPNAIYFDELPIFQDFRISDNSTCESCIIWEDNIGTAIVVHTLKDYSVEEFVSACEEWEYSKNYVVTMLEKDYNACIDTSIIGQLDVTSVFNHNNMLYQITIKYSVNMSGDKADEGVNIAGQFFGYILKQIITT